MGTWNQVQILPRQPTIWESPLARTGMQLLASMAMVKVNSKLTADAAKSSRDFAKAQAERTFQGQMMQKGWTPGAEEGGVEGPYGGQWQQPPQRTLGTQEAGGQTFATVSGPRGVESATAISPTKFQTVKGADQFYTFNPVSGELLETGIKSDSEVKWEDFTDKSGQVTRVFTNKKGVEVSRQNLGAIGRAGTTSMWDVLGGGQGIPGMPGGQGVQSPAEPQASSWPVSKPGQHPINPPKTTEKWQGAGTYPDVVNEVMKPLTTKAEYDAYFGGF